MDKKTREKVNAALTYLSAKDSSAANFLSERFCTIPLTLEHLRTKKILKHTPG